MKKVLSLVLAFVMLFSVTIPSAWAAEGETVEETATTINGRYDQAGIWEQGVGDGTITVTNPISGTDVKLSKTVAPTEVENEFDITMGVETAVAFNTAATVLVMDVSGSMSCCAECGREYEHGLQCIYNNNPIPGQCPVEYNQTRIAAAKEAAKAFLKKYRGEPSDVGRYVAIVAFSNDVHENKVKWLDLSQETDYVKAVSLVDGLKIGGATNLDAGLHRADELLRTDSVARDQKNVIVLTDGEPTYYCHGGDGQYGSQEINDETAATAKLLQKDAFLYTVCFSAEKRRCFPEGPTVGEFLRDDIATSSMGAQRYAYSADSTKELLDAFDRIADSVVEGTNGGGWVVDDPMGPFVTVKEAPDYVSVSENGKRIQGELTRPQISKQNGSTIYTYELTYRITLDTNAEGFKENTFYPTNGRTYVIDPGKARAEFPVPGVKGKLPHFTVTYNRGDHGQLVGQEVYPNLTKYTATPADPAVTAEEGYYFTGWQPAVAPTVTEDVTYIAQYAPKREITVVANSDKVTYDGQKHSAAGFKQTEFEIDGKIYSVEGLTASVVGTNAGEYVSEVTGTPVVKCGDKDVSEQFIVTTEDGKLTIDKRPVAVDVVGNTEVKAYDGAEQSVTGYTVQVKDPLYKEKNIQFTGEAVTSGTDVGTYFMSLKEEQFSNTDNNFNVTFNVKDGSLQITPMDAVVVTITGHKDSGMYSGAKQSVAGYDVKISNPLYEETDFTFIGDATAEGTNVGVYPMGLKPENFENANANFKNVVFEVTDGALEITPRTVKLTSGSGSKTYDGTPLTAETVTAEGFVDGEGATYYGFVSIINKGSVENTFDYEFNGNTLAKNYSITKIPGKLTVKAIDKELQVWAASDRRVYNGEPLTNESYTYTGGILAEGDKLIAEVNGSALHVGDAGVNEVSKVTIYNKDSEDVTANYANITKEKGTLTVTPRGVTIVSASATKTYDGKALTAESVTYKGEGFVGEEGVECTNFASITDVGTRKNTFGYTPKSGTLEKDYTIDKSFGELEVTPNANVIVITAASESKMYDGTALTNRGYTYTDGILAEGDKLIAVVEGAATNVTDEGINQVVSYKVMRGDTDVTKNYTFGESVNGKLSITPRDVTLISDSASKMYDGTALTAETVSVSGSGFVDGEGAAYDGFVSITDAGQMENTFRYTLTENTLSDNYTIAVVNGLLTVNKHTGAKLEAKGYKGIYDGMAHDGVSDKQVVAGVDSDEWKYTYSTDGETFVPEMPQFKDVGTYTVYVKATNDNYEGDALITTVPVEITPAVITVTADSHTIATGDTDPKLGYQADTAVAAETPAFRGELVRSPGSTKGVYAIKQGTLALTDGEGFKAANYTLAYVPGELTILQRALDITKTVNKTKACVGDELVYTIIVTNTGDVDLENVVLEDEMLHVQENIGELPAGKSVTREYTYVVTEEDEGTQLVNTAVVTADGGTANEGDSEATLVKPKAPQTGDSSALQLWMMGTLVSATGLIVLGTQRKKFMRKG